MTTRGNVASCTEWWYWKLQDPHEHGRGPQRLPRCGAIATSILGCLCPDRIVAGVRTVRFLCGGIPCVSDRSSVAAEFRADHGDVTWRRHRGACWSDCIRMARRQNRPKIRRRGEFFAVLPVCGIDCLRERGILDCFCGAPVPGRIWLRWCRRKPVC